jgi:hypothetical protein
MVALPGVSVLVDVVVVFGIVMSLRMVERYDRFVRFLTRESKAVGGLSPSPPLPGKCNQKPFACCEQLEQ